MAAYHNDLSQFRQLRDQAARKKQLEARRAGLLPQCQDLAAQAEARKTERLEAEQELAGLESKGPLGLLYTIAGGKAQRLEDAFAAARQARSEALRTAGLPQSQQLLSLDESLTHEAGLTQAITDLCGQCRTALESAQQTLKLAGQAEQRRDFSITELLQYTANQTVQLQQALAQDLSALLARAEEEQLRLAEARDDLLAQDLFPDPDLL